MVTLDSKTVFDTVCGLIVCCIEKDLPYCVSSASVTNDVRLLVLINVSPNPAVSYVFDPMLGDPTGFCPVVIDSLC